MLRSSRMLPGVLLLCASIEASSLAAAQGERRIVPLPEALKGFMIPSRVSYNILDWSVQADADATLPITWITSGVDWSTQPAKRKGTIYLAVGGVTTVVLKQRLEPAPWKVILYGAHAGVEQVTLANQIMSRGPLDVPGSLRAAGFSLKARGCAGNNEYWKAVLYELRFAGFQRAWLVVLSDFGGTAGFGYTLDLFNGPDQPTADDVMGDSASSLHGKSFRTCSPGT